MLQKMGVRWLFSFFMIALLFSCGTQNMVTKPQDTEVKVKDYILFERELAVPRNPVCGDFNGDGLMDVAVVQKPPFLNVFYNSANGLKQPITYESNTHNTFMTSVDLNGDGRLDLLPVTEAQVGPMFINTGESFNKNDYAETTPIFGIFVASADLNNDGLPDIVTTGLHEPMIKVLFNKGGGVFDVKQIYLDGGETAQDSKKEDLKTSTDPLIKRMLPQSQDVRRKHVSSSRSGHGIREVFFFDFNKDGYLDLVFGTYTGKDLFIITNDKGRAFNVNLIKSFEHTISSVVAKELKNGNQIIAVALESKGTVVILQREGSNEYKVIKEFTVKDAPRKLLLTDLDGSGQERLLVSSQTSDSMGYHLSVIDPENLDGGVTEVFLPQYDCLYINVCDIYGKRDLLCSDINRGKFFILKNTILKEKSLKRRGVKK